MGKNPAKYGEGGLNYGEYLKVPDLLRLQQCLSKPGHPDELQFIVVHQVYELWFKLVLHELDASFAAMDRGDLPSLREAARALRRVAAVQRLLLDQVHILETMRPIDFLRFRDPLKPASGFQSTQFREIEFLGGLKEPKLLELCSGDPDLVARARKRYESPTLWDGFCAALKKGGFRVEPGASTNEAELRRLYERPEQFPDLYELAECLIEFDERLQLWREHHVRMVERMIGNKPGTGAPVNQGLEGARYLRSTVGKKCFPELWAVRSQIELPEQTGA